MRNYITSEIERRRAELVALEERRLILRSQLSVLEDLLARVPDEAPPRRVRAGRSSSRSSDKGRLSPRWLSVLAEAVRRYPGTIRGEEVPDIQGAAGQEPARTSNNIRSHFWTNTKPGKFYERVGTSEYRATEVGARLVGMPLGGTKRSPENSNGASHEPAPSPDFENRDEPSISSDRLDLLNPSKAPLPGGGT